MRHDRLLTNLRILGLICALMLFCVSCAKNANTRRDPPMPLTQEDLPPLEAKPDYLALARQLIEKGHYDVALVQLEEEEKKQGTSPETRVLTGVCEHAEGRLTKAEQAYRDALRINPDYPPAYNRLGVTLFALDRREEAREALARAVSLNPGDAEFQNNLGYAYLAEGRLLEAEKCFRKSIALMPDYSLALNNLGFCLVQQGRDEEALEVFLRTLPVGEAYNNLGAAYERLGDRDKALLLYKHALRKSPDLIQARRNTARLERSLIRPSAEGGATEKAEVPRP